MIEGGLKMAKASQAYPPAYCMEIATFFDGVIIPSSKVKQHAMNIEPKAIGGLYIA